MRPTRFTLKRSMVAVAILAAILGFERLLFVSASALFSDRGREEPILAEVLAMCFLWHIPIVGLAMLIARFLRRL